MVDRESNKWGLSTGATRVAFYSCRDWNRLASWREIDRIRKAPAEFRAVAKRLLNLGAELTEWESNFLKSNCNDTETKEFTTRQSEKLLQIPDDYETITTFHGFSVETCSINVGSAASIFRKVRNRSSKKCESGATFQ